MVLSLCPFVTSVISVVFCSSICELGRTAPQSRREFFLSSAYKRSLLNRILRHWSPSVPPGLGLLFFFVSLSLCSSLENVHSLVQDLSATSQFKGSVSSRCRSNDVSQRASELSPHMALISDTRCMSSFFAAGWLLLRAQTPTSRSLRFRSWQGHPLHLTQIELLVLEKFLAGAAVSFWLPFGMEVCHS